MPMTVRAATPSAADDELRALVDLRGRAPGADQGLEHAHLDTGSHIGATGSAGPRGWRACWWRCAGALVRATALVGSPARGVRVVVAEPEPPLPAQAREELGRRLDLALIRLDREGAALPDVVEELVRIPVAGSVRGRLGCLVVLDLRADGRVDASARCAPGPLRLGPDGAPAPICSPVGSAAVTLAPGEALVVTTPSALDGPGDPGDPGATPALLHGQVPGSGPCELLDRLAVAGFAPGLPRAGAEGAPAAAGSAVLAVMRGR